MSWTEDAISKEEPLRGAKFSSRYLEGKWCNLFADMGVILKSISRK
jgi:hypothetical protein